MLITLEGGEGSGKSTVAKELASRVEATGRGVTVTQEPMGTALGRRIWEFFQDPDPPPITPLAELILFEAARAQHVEKLIRPALALGNVVICDRYTDSSIAYQGHGRALPISLIETLNNAATGGLEPDLTLLLDIPVEIGLERARRPNNAGKTEDAIGEESLEFHLRVHAGFQAIATANPYRVVKIDAAAPLDDVLEESWQAIERLMARA
jgi:dTMP kinase